MNQKLNINMIYMADGLNLSAIFSALFRGNYHVIVVYSLRKAVYIFQNAMACCKKMHKGSCEI